MFKTIRLDFNQQTWETSCKITKKCQNTNKINPFLGLPRCKNLWHFFFVLLARSGVWLLFNGLLALLFSLFYVIREFDKFLHRGWAQIFFPAAPLWSNILEECTTSELNTSDEEESRQTELIHVRELTFTPARSVNCRISGKLLRAFRSLLRRISASTCALVWRELRFFTAS